MKCRAFVFDAHGTLFDVHSVVLRASNSIPGDLPAYQPEFKGNRNLPACPHCGCTVRPNRLEEHLRERCPNLHVLKKSVISPKPQAIPATGGGKALSNPIRASPRLISYIVCPVELHRRLRGSQNAETRDTIASVAGLRLAQHRYEEAESVYVDKI
jgi:hypothetical protein